MYLNTFRDGDIPIYQYRLDSINDMLASTK